MLAVGAAGDVGDAPWSCESYRRTNDRVLGSYTLTGSAWLALLVLMGLGAFLEYSVPSAVAGRAGVVLPVNQGPFLCVYFFVVAEPTAGDIGLEKLTDGLEGEPSSASVTSDSC